MFFVHKDFFLFCCIPFWCEPLFHSLAGLSQCEEPNFNLFLIKPGERKQKGSFSPSGIGMILSGDYIQKHPCSSFLLSLQSITLFSVF